LPARFLNAGAAGGEATCLNMLPTFASGEEMKELTLKVLLNDDEFVEFEEFHVQ
jgi:hypothetical protein